MNQPESFTCECNEGFVGNGLVGNQLRCRDLNECHAEKHNCDSDTTVCFNTMGSFICRCKGGYKGYTDKEETKCLDVNECYGSPCASDEKECRNKGFLMVFWVLTKD